MKLMMTFDFMPELTHLVTDKFPIQNYDTRWCFKKVYDNSGMYQMKTLCVFCNKLASLLIDPKMPIKESLQFECENCKAFVAELTEVNQKDEDLERLV